MTDELDNFDLFKGSSDQEADLLGELDSLKGLLSDEPDAAPDEDIPLLDDVVSHPDEASADAQGLRAAMAAAPSPSAPKPFIPPVPPPRPPLVQERELEMMVDKIIDKEMPRIRVELKRVLMSELRLRGVLK